MDYTGFGKDEYEAFKANDRPGPVHMLNLVRLRETANYEDGTRSTGQAAYAAYGRLSAPVLERVGGRIVWRGRMEQMVIGPRDQTWDLCFIAEYPEPGAFLAMLKDPDYRVAMAHRQAAVQDSRLIRMEPLSLGAGFGGD
ncbi:DUF1330 domain-containing protein [Sedimentitalea arenosa]|jgi:uncharacterized protein (DUF1330 family)|uniref:DUF1330 domain-containing protein n=1 Tax=Sedimentitalea arenosa TaxID=2798803 RepID=A0A8J7M026_9RHOB|nr:DUF1330 domain-containing protein [Arenibacterium arenosum]MBJ6373586.1 DUF1330 domain-containing protein [Arenibacterium arenosum]